MFADKLTNIYFKALSFKVEPYGSVFLRKNVNNKTFYLA